MEGPFTAAEVDELACRTSEHKAVTSPLPPGSSDQQCRTLHRQWPQSSTRGIGHGSSHLTMPTAPSPWCPGSAPLPARQTCVAEQSTPCWPNCTAVDAMLAKLYAAGLERRVSDYAEAAGQHAEGQFGFRRRRCTKQAILALRTAMECYSLPQRRGNGRSQLCACFDF